MKKRVLGLFLLIVLATSLVIIASDSTQYTSHDNNDYYIIGYSPHKYDYYTIGYSRSYDYYSIEYSQHKYDYYANKHHLVQL